METYQQYMDALYSDITRLFSTVAPKKPPHTVSKELRDWVFDRGFKIARTYKPTEDARCLKSDVSITMKDIIDLSAINDPRRKDV